MNEKKLQLYVYFVLYVIATVILHWRLSPNISIIWFILGAFIGLHLLTVWEHFVFKVPLSLIRAQTPLRSVFMQLIIIALTFFVITSTSSALGSGLVLSLSLFYLYIQFKEYEQGTLGRWFGQKSPEKMTQKRYLWLLLGVFILETFLFSAL